MKAKRIAIFASGNGSNAVNITNFFQEKTTGEVALLICNNPTAPVLERMKAFKVPLKVVERKEFNGESLISKLRDFEIDVVVLAGFLWLIPSAVVKAYPMLNIHPSLLPKHGGQGMYGMHVHRAVLEAGERISGITIHEVNERFDEGKVIAQYTCEVSAEDSIESLAAKIRNLERTHFPHVIETYLNQQSYEH